MVTFMRFMSFMSFNNLYFWWLAILNGNISNLWILFRPLLMKFDDMQFIDPINLNLDTPFCISKLCIIYKIIFFLPKPMWQIGHNRINKNTLLTVFSNKLQKTWTNLSFLTFSGQILRPQENFPLMKTFRSAFTPLWFLISEWKFCTTLKSEWSPLMWEPFIMYIYGVGELTTHKLSSGY